MCGNLHQHFLYALHDVVDQRVMRVRHRRKFKTVPVHFQRMRQRGQSRKPSRARDAAQSVNRALGGFADRACVGFAQAQHFVLQRNNALLRLDHKDIEKAGGQMDIADHQVIDNFCHRLGMQDFVWESCVGIAQLRFDCFISRFIDRSECVGFNDGFVGACRFKRQ